MRVMGRAVCMDWLGTPLYPGADGGILDAGAWSGVLRQDRDRAASQCLAAGGHEGIAATLRCGSEGRGKEGLIKSDREEKNSDEENEILKTQLAEHWEPETVEQDKTEPAEQDKTEPAEHENTR
ncbi:hypothetical protein E2C01_099522 [Portunus trituberculatus]|uniref:Uncharacterized protein n=1 Tax=Portunus trituberculatus TaxID=210409 RepID=A0A5B7KAL4_PORTR|nr:hypothetical protein [Portunus trituberculatus]